MAGHLSETRRRLLLLAAAVATWSAVALAASAPGAVAAINIDQAVARAKAIYQNEVSGWKLRQQLTRIAADQIMLRALAQGNAAAAQAEADAQLHAPIEHYAHVTRISVLQGSRVLVNATVNSDGVFVVAPGSRVLRWRGRVVGTLLVSLQDVTGYVKLIDDITGADALVRGSSGNVRTSLPTALHAPLPASGRVMIASRPYLVRSFTEIGWGNEKLTVWVLVGA
jgi:hypothetical protein